VCCLLCDKTHRWWQPRTDYHPRVTADAVSQLHVQSGRSLRSEAHASHYTLFDFFAHNIHKFVEAVLRSTSFSASGHFPPSWSSVGQRASRQEFLVTSSHWLTLSCFSAHVGYLALLLFVKRDGHIGSFVPMCSQSLHRQSAR
jgi:hypothetical protein